jgi:ubiquinone biosynthesis protein UbiJ
MALTIVILYAILLDLDMQYYIAQTASQQTAQQKTQIVLDQSAFFNIIIGAMIGLVVKIAYDSIVNHANSNANKEVAKVNNDIAMKLLERVNNCASKEDLKIFATKAEFSQLETKVDNLETKVDNLETKFDNLETKVDGINTRLDKFFAVLINSPFGFLLTKDK